MPGTLHLAFMPVCKFMQVCKFMLRAHTARQSR